VLIADLDSFDSIRITFTERNAQYTTEAMLLTAGALLSFHAGYYGVPKVHRSCGSIIDGLAGLIIDARDNEANTTLLRLRGPRIRRHLLPPRRWVYDTCKNI